MSMSIPGIPGSRRWRREHGISDRVWSARGYVRYRAGDPGPIREAFEAAECAPNQIGWATRAAEKGDGLIMPAHALPVPGLRPIPPQLRPHDPIQKQPKLHYHPAELPPAGSVVRDPTTGKPVPETHWSTAWAMRRHIAGEHGAELAAALGYRTPIGLHRLCFDSSCRADLERVLAEANDPEPHQHENIAKYLLTITPRTAEHDHADYVSSYWRRRHIEKYHGGVDVAGPHVHDGVGYAKTSFEDRDPSRSPGRRIDVLPPAWELLAAAEVVYFVLEGKIKGDAALSSILERGLAASVADVPSVGQWEAPELDALCERLTGKTVVIVVDSDADENDQVMTQGVRLRFRLREHGLIACLAAPPPDDRAGIDEADRFEKVGLDDHLGALESSLDDLRVIRFEVPCHAFARWKIGYERRAGRRDRVRRDARTLHGLALLCGPTGQTSASLEKVARFVRLEPDDIERAVASLIEAGVVEVDKPLSTRRWFRRRYDDPERGSLRSRRIWIEPPRIMIKNEALWARDLPPMRLADWLRDPPEEDTYTMQELIEQDDRALEMADLIANGESVKAVAERYGLAPRTVRDLPEVQAMLGLRQAVLDALILALRMRGCSARLIAEALSKGGVAVSRKTIDRVLALRMKHAPAWAWDALLWNEEIARLIIAAFERGDEDAAERLIALLWNELCPRSAPTGHIPAGLPLDDELRLRAARLAEIGAK